MPSRACLAVYLVLSLPIVGCGSEPTESESPTDDPNSDETDDSNRTSTKDAGGDTKIDAGKKDAGGPAKDAGKGSSVDAGATTADASPPIASRDTDASTVLPDAGGAGGNDAGHVSGGTALTGMLGALGAVQPTVSSVVISNSGETLLYLTSTPITCAQLMMSRWLGSIPAGTQVVELVIKGAPKVGSVQVGPLGGEVNYAEGGKSSAYEKSASSGTITFSEAAANGPVTGTVTGTFSNPPSMVMGTFHAEFCAGGQGY